MLLLRACNDRGGKRMFGIPFGTSCDRQQIICHFTPFSKRKHVGQRRFASGDRTCFVKYDSIDFATRLQRFSGTNQHAHLRGATGRNRYGKRCGKTQCARACDQKHRNRRHQRMHHARFRPERKPQCARPYGDQHHNRHENTGNLIRHALYRSFGTLRGLHQSNDLREHRVFADFCGTIPQRSGTVDRGTGHTAASLLQHRHGLAGDHGFVDRR